VVSRLSAVSRGSALHSVGRTLGVPGGVSVLVTCAPDEDGILRCGDEILTPQPPPACSVPLAEIGTIRPGQWFTDPVSGLKAVCTRAGQGVLTFAGRPMQRHAAPSGSAFVPSRRR
jgi:hypothetical protein